MVRWRTQPQILNDRVSRFDRIHGRHSARKQRPAHHAPQVYLVSLASSRVDNIDRIGTKQCVNVARRPAVVSRYIWIE